MKKLPHILVWQSILVHYEKIDPKPPNPVTHFILSEDALMEIYKNSNTHLNKSWQILKVGLKAEDVYQVLCSTSNNIFRNLPMLNFSIFL